MTSNLAPLNLVPRQTAEINLDFQAFSPIAQKMARNTSIKRKIVNKQVSNLSKTVSF